MRVPEAAQRAADAGALAGVRAVRVALLVGVRVVLAVVGDPVDDAGPARPASRVIANAYSSQLVRLERAVREQPVIADRDAEPGDDVHHGEDREVAPVHQVRVPEQRRSRRQRDERAEDGGEVDVPVGRVMTCSVSHQI